MKKTLILGLGIAALASLTACSQNEEILDTVSAQAKGINFNVYSGMTRADVTNTNITTLGDNFAVAAYGTDKNIYLGKGSSTHTGAEITYSSATTSWEYKNGSDIKFWPATALDFYAYYPVSGTTASFAASYSATSDNVLSITAWTDGKDVMTTSKIQQTYNSSMSSEAQRVPMEFRHAFAKIEKINLTVNIANISLSVSDIELVKSVTMGTINVAQDGTMSHAPHSSIPAPRSFKPVSAVAVANATATDIYNSSATGAKPYIFPEVNSKIWSYESSAPTDPTAKLSLKLTFKVTNDASSTTSTSDIVSYIPLMSDSDTSFKLEAGKKYTINIVMNSHLGFSGTSPYAPIQEVAGVFSPIKFKVDSSAGVAAWSDATINITL